jgi:hypothetical protein
MTKDELIAEINKMRDDIWNYPGNQPVHLKEIMLGMIGILATYTKDDDIYLLSLEVCRDIEQRLGEYGRTLIHQDEE